MKRVISTDNAPKAIGPYSQAIESSGFLFVSGQLPIDPKTGQMGESIEVQTLQSLRNIKAILVEAGYDTKDIVKTTVFLKDMSMFSKMNEVYASFFKETKPARATVEVARLPKDALVEIEAICSK